MGVLSAGPASFSFLPFNLRRTSLLGTMGSASPRHSPSGRESLTHDVSPPCEQDVDVPPVSSPHQPFVEEQLRPSPPQPSASPPHMSFPASSPASSSSCSSSSSSPLPFSSASSTPALLASFAPPPPLSASVSCPFPSSASSSSPSSSSSAAVSAPCAPPLSLSSSALSSSSSASAAASAPSSASLSASAFLSSLSSPSSFFPSSFSSPSSFVSRRGDPVCGAPSELGVEMLLAGDSPSDSSTADESDVASTAPSVSLLQHSNASLSSAAALHGLSPRTSSTPPTVGNRSLEGSLDNNPSLSERGDASERERDGEERGWNGTVEEREGRRGRRKGDRKVGKRGRRSNASLFLSPAFRAGCAQGAGVGRNVAATAWREREGRVCTFNAPVPLSASAFLRGVVTPPPLRPAGLGEVDERNRLPSRFSSSSSSPCRSPAPFSPPSHLSSPGGHEGGEATSGETGLTDSPGNRPDRGRRCRLQGGETERRTDGDSCGASLSEGSFDGAASLSSSNARRAQHVTDAGRREEDEGELESRSWERRSRGRQRGSEEAKKHDGRGRENSWKERRHSDGQDSETLDGRETHCAGLATGNEAEGIARGVTRQTQAEAPSEETEQHHGRQPTGEENLEAEGRPVRKDFAAEQ
ncbi:hypothetical protein TGMAS_257580 [Toxoplasma gondii MAS]|uniref:Uncharacterized protein n=1 Tax=Toxoplasma gondii MAS TaxID=943118 RepID=A0A086QLN6_TOXGO|nr:hypothetical protein TGMAS_257580 [Toxoplasma gondii MAS]